MLKKELTDKKLLGVLNKQSCVCMLAPSFVAEFNYPDIIQQLKSIGFDKVVELTFGAKMINRDYHKILEAEKLKNKRKLIISSVCPGIVETIKLKYPKLKNNLIKVDSPMAAMAKICKKTFPKHKTVFISPCNFKKTEAERIKYIDYVIDYQELHKLIDKIRPNNVNRESWDKFYNDYTKIYPLAGGLSKTAHLKGAITKDEIKVIDGIADVEKFLRNKNNLKNKKIRFLDVNFCKGGCIGGPHLSKTISLAQKKKRVLHYIQIAKEERIPECRKGEIKEAKGIIFTDTKF